MMDKIAIVGMEAVFGADEGLHTFDRSVFDGARHSSPEAPRKKRRKLRAGVRAETREAHLQAFGGKGPPSDAALVTWVLGGVLGDARGEGRSAAWSGLGLVVVAAPDLDVPCPGAAVVERESSAARALRRAEDLLSDPRLRGVVLLGVHREGVPVVPDPGSPAGGLGPGEGAGAVLLKRADRARQDGERVYALMEPSASSAGDPDAASTGASRVAETCGEALRAAGLQPSEIGYVETAGLGQEGEAPAEIQGLHEAYRAAPTGTSCALGSVRANFGCASPVSGLAGLIRVALSLYHRYIPATPGWTGPADGAPWEGSPFYVAPESRPWFVEPSRPRRHAALNLLDAGDFAHRILSEAQGDRPRPSRYLALVSPYCFPLAGDGPADLLEQLDALNRALEGGCPLISEAGRAFDRYQVRLEAPRAMVVVGHSREELLKETGFMLGRIAQAQDEGAELRTPKGSYFTPRPLGSDGKVAFVYPGVGSAYLGLGHGLFHLFPELYEPFARQARDMGDLLKERQLYPRSVERLTEDEIWKSELQLRKDIMTMGECGMGFFALFTMVLRDCFKIAPQMAIGYSMGEPGMMASLGVWEGIEPLKEKFVRSPIFTERLNGRLTAVREYWGLGAEAPEDPGEIWNSFTLQAAPDTVRQAMAGEDRVFLTIINTSEEVVIAGDPAGCKRVIERVGCRSYPLSLNLAIHSAPARVEYDELVGLYTLPTERKPELKLYSSSCYKAIPVRSKAVAHSISKAFCEPVDFPRLVNQAHEDGARIFIEVGARKFCTNLIDKILEGRDHLAMAVNVKGTRDEISLVRVLAQLVGHRVPVDLSPLYERFPEG